MTYEEAKQTAAGLLKDMPEQMSIMHYSGNGDEFVAIAYSPLTDEERELARNGGYRWDMLIKRKEIEYRQFYMDIRNRPVKAPPRKFPISKVTSDQLSYFLQGQLFITLHPGEL
jgi:hypothetical protein